MSDDFHPVLSCDEAIHLEQELLNGEPESEWRAMQRAGRALAKALYRDYQEMGDLPDRPAMLVLAGKGHNAGDAFIAARELLAVRPKATIDVLFLMGEDALNLLARRAWKALLDVAEDPDAICSLFLDQESSVVGQLKEMCGRRYQICFDGVFGMNFRPPFRAPMDAVATWMNAELIADLRAAVDMPSGLSDAPAELAFRADFTYMTGSAKKPLFEIGNSDWAGRLRYLDLGFFKNEGDESSRAVLLPEVLRPMRGLRRAMTHKRKYGHLAIVGGSRSMPGAILMSILAALRSGVGLVTAAVPESLVPGFSTVAPEAMWIGCPETEEGGLGLDGIHAIERALSKATAVLVGPGVGVEPETQAFLEELARKTEVPMVIDAEALQPRIIERIRMRAGTRGKVVITPHMEEFARITGQKFADIGEEGLLEFCQNSGLVTLLKGPPFTRLCEGERILYGLAGGPVLARGGSGDILAGLVGSLVARSPGEIMIATRRAIVWHGLAAEALARDFGQEGVRTTQLLDFLPRVLRETGPE